MPIVSINGEDSIVHLRPLSKFWTYYRISSEAQVLTQQKNNEKVQEMNIRYHINAAISHIADLLSLAAEPWYGITILGTLDTAHPTGLDRIDLSTFQDLDRFIHHIERVNIVNGTRIGNLSKWDLSMMTQQRSGWNLQHDQTATWTHLGSDILMFFGKDVDSPANALEHSSYDVSSADFAIVGYRQPILDDMLPESTSLTYKHTKDTDIPQINEYIDLPDRYAKLLIDMVQASILQQVNVDIPKQIEQSINQATQQLTSMIDAKRQFEVNAKQGYDRNLNRIQPPGGI